ncbi:MAG TPA: FtsX-like permease family protein [Ktedonobacterales bacterium]|nr:FtsX-like permease family protein [Ktedonobacterales bacterium]
MSALLTKILGDLRRRRLQAFVIFVIVMLTAGVGTLGIEVLSGASAPFDSAFEQNAGAHAQVLFHNTLTDLNVLAPTTRLPDVTASAGPWPSSIIPFAFGTTKAYLRVVGRADPGGPVDRLNLVAGRWVTQPGEIVLTRSFALESGLVVGDRLAAISRSDAPTLTLVGEVVDIDEAGASLQTPQYAWVMPEQVAGLLPADTKPDYIMLYRFRQAATAADLQQDIDKIAAALPPNTIANTLTYLVVKQIFALNSFVILGSLLAFAAFALGAVALIIANVVTGAVLASYREIGIIKALGFTPGQVVLTFVGQMLLPALAGCVIGVPLGVLGSIPILNSSYQALDLPAATLLAPVPALLTAVGILLVVSLFATLPALRAGLLRPVAAITRGAAPGPQRRSRLAALLQRLRLPRTLSLGAGDAFARPLRGLLTALAVLIAVATLTFAFGLQASFQRFVAIPGFFAEPDITITRYGDYPDSKVMQTLQAQPETQRVVASSFTSVEVPGLSSPVNAQPMRGSSPADGYLLSAGRWFSGPGEAVGGLAFVQEAHLKVGDSFTVVLNNHSLQLRLVGIYFDGNNFGRVLRFDWSSYLAALPDAQPDQYTLTLRAGADLQAYARHVSATAPNFLGVQARPSGPPALIAIANTVIAILAAVLGAIAVAGVFNTVLLNTRERTQDIATLKALGMTPGQVMSMVLTSACVLGLLGGVLGIPLGIWLHRTLLDLTTSAIGDPLPASFYQGAFDNLAVLALLALGGILAALLGAALPARNAARHSVVEVLRAE